MSRLGIVTAVSARGAALYFCARYPGLRRSFAIPSHLTAVERGMLYRLAVGRESIVEIGSYTGASACCFAEAIRASGGAGRVVCIDTWNNNAMTEGERDTWSEFSRNTDAYASILIPVMGLSSDMFRLVSDIAPRVDLLFIDGDHSYEGVRTDWRTYAPLLAPGATIVFHDYGWADGVRAVVHDEVMPVVSYHQAMRNMWWGTLGDGVR